MTRSPDAHRSDFVVRCACGLAYNSDDAHIGKRIKCRCGKLVTVVRPVDESGQRRGSAKTASDDSRTRRRRAASPNGARRWLSWRLPTFRAPPWRRIDRTLASWLYVTMGGMLSRRPVTRWTARAACAWSGVVLVTWLLLITTSESFLPATLLAYGPRFVLLAPFVLLLPLAAAFARGTLIPLAIALFIVLGPIMGGRVSHHTLGRAMPARGPTDGGLRVLTFNTQNARYALRLQEFITQNAPDLVALQECHETLWNALKDMPGWYVTRHESLCSLSRWPILSTDTMPRQDFSRVSQFGFGGTGLVLRQTLRSPRGPFVFVNLHLETARKGLEGLLGKGGLIPDGVADAGKIANPSPRASRRIELNAMIRDRESERAAIWSIRGDKRVPALVAGDFNLPVESAIFRRHWSGFTDAFDATGTGFGWTKREGSLLRIRIDHVLGTESSPRPRGAWVGADLGSDHLPVIADFAWPDR